VVARGGEQEKAELEEDDQEVQTSRGFPGGSVVKNPFLLILNPLLFLLQYDVSPNVV